MTHDLSSRPYRQSQIARRPLRVLAVEDDVMLGRMLVRLLSTEGYDVVQAVTAREGLRLLQEQDPDIVLLDLMLPDGDGLDVCRVVREGERANRPVIVVSARTAPLDRRRAVEAGASSFLSKPFEPDELLRMVNGCLDPSG
ncbi:MAG: response regulator [Chloroflexi bacterium]|nr:response regulator [Chloroflexota bacterium]